MGLSYYDERPSAMKRDSPLTPHASRLSNERGVALVVVLWIFIFLSVVAFEFSVTVREEGMAASRYVEESEGYYLAVAGFQQALYELLQQLPQGGRAGFSDAASFEEGWHDGSLDNGFYRARLIDEAGKVNLNRIDEQTLRRVFANLGIEERQAAILADSILDWRDEDNLHRTNGAENDYYFSLSPRYTAKNGLFEAVEDLLWVRGVTPELFYGVEENGIRRIGLREIFTVDSPLDRVNLRTASAAVIHALLGIPLEKSQALVEERAILSEKTFADLLKLFGIGAGDAALRQFVFISPSVITIEAIGYASEPVSRRMVKGVVRLAGGPRGFELLRWIDRGLDRGP